MPAICMLLATVRQESGALVTVGSTHLPARDETARLAAAGQLSEINANLTTPWLICGDFTMAAEQWSPPTGEVTVAPAPSAGTYPTRAPARSIDDVVASPEVMVEGWVLPVPGSDHLPVLVRAVMPPPLTELP